MSNLNDWMKETDTSEPLPEPPSGESAASTTRGWLDLAVEWIGELLERMFYRGTT